ncbi:MAG: SWIM zinc finger family protein [Lentisphaeria bacterium]
MSRRRSRGYGWGDWGYPPYVSVAEKKERNAKLAQKLAQKNKDLHPVVITGRKLAKTFWGNAWCENVESYQDYSNRLSRGRSYVRNGAVLDLQITTGMVTALVAGSERKPYEVEIKIKRLEKAKWEELKNKCVGKISSVLDLVQGKLSSEIIKELCHKETGLFPSLKEIETRCSCPDMARLCKHLAAVFYGIGARLDENPELFFKLRGVDEAELIGVDVVDALTDGVEAEIALDKIDDVFGMTFDSLNDVAPTSKKKHVLAKKRLPPVTWTAKGIVRLRNRLKLTKKEFALLCGISQAQLTRLEGSWLDTPSKFYPKLNELFEHKAKRVPRKSSSKKEELPTALCDRWDNKKIDMLLSGLKLSQSALAKVCGVYPAKIAQWQCEGAFVPKKYYSKLDDLLSCYRQSLGKGLPKKSKKSIFKYSKIWNGEQVYLLRQELGLTQKAFAFSCGTYQGKISNWELGGVGVPIKGEWIPKLNELAGKGRPTRS